ncbi:hypothetical protein SAMN03080598_00880 [Algoriphagus boritolerans DSM 17298 = JCM 18970]|uniref:Uncharacterized protein n=1 Tax=Algoriphagus boritolerans DSM 17298 = JCM 18970 TaxID=1120964 RepID=A0A1H5TRQ1_9BACT|nr:hypothetical protein SAMN03080598_00880 [Algoriphagus boritolerans DSM 17298 = JCM 18970]
MKKKSLLLVCFAFVFSMGITFSFESNAADCIQANSIGCFDRFGTFYPTDIKGLPDCCPPSQ